MESGTQRMDQSPRSYKEPFMWAIPTLLWTCAVGMFHDWPQVFPRISLTRACMPSFHDDFP